MPTALSKESSLLKKKVTPLIGGRKPFLLSAGIAHRSSLTVLWAPGGTASGSVSTALGTLNQPRKNTTVVTSEAKRSNNKGAKRTPRSLH